MSDERYIALQVLMMPKDANPTATVMPDGGGTPLYRTIFGGVLLSYLDQAGAIGAIREVVKAGGPVPQLVTVAINRVEFKHPVLVGDVVKFQTRLVRLGRTSITMNVQVESERGLEALQVATLWLAQHGMANPNDAGAGAVDYLWLMGIVVTGWMWARMAKHAQTKLAGNPQNSPFYEQKLISARYWMERMMPECAMLRARVEAGSATLMAFEAGQ